MDLTFTTEHAKLNIRVAVILNSKDGYLFCESKDGYYFAVGGRVKINESSLEAAHREVLEELNYSMQSVELCTVLENFFTHQSTGTLVHEFCFIYKCNDIVDVALPEFFVAIPATELSGKDIRPSLITELIMNPTTTLSHKISK